MAKVTTEVRGPVFLIGLNRPDKRNAFDREMLRQLAAAYTRYEDDPALWCAVLFAHGDHFTAGLDLADVGPSVARGEALFDPSTVDPLQASGRPRSKPLVVAVQGWCLTIGIELMLAADIRIAAADTRLGQIEIKRGIFPFGGATVRWPSLTGWGNAMRYLLTGDELDAKEAHRIGLVQELTEPGGQLDLALDIASRVAKQAPLAVQATLASSRTAVAQGPQAAFDVLGAQAKAIFATEDAKEGMMSFMERREATFSGR